MALHRSYLFILTATLAVIHCSCVNLTTLRLSQVVYRHGDRAPMFAYPTDPYKDVQKYWPNGFGQLTQRGMDQQYDLGEYLRQRYDGFVDRKYDRKQIHVLSSDVDRTLMSAEANLAGLFPKLTTFSEDGAISGAKVDMQLVPIHTLTDSSDKLLHMVAECPRLDEALEEYKNTSPEIAKIREENEDFFQYVKHKTGRPEAKDVFSFMKTGDILYCQQQHNLTLPSWANETVMERMRYISAIDFAMKGGTPELRRLIGGPLVERLMNNMVTQTTKNREQLPKMYMHSGHDDTLAALLTTLGVFDPQNPGYASVFIMDLHQEESTGKYFVEMFYRNTTEHEPYPLQVAGCGTPCYLEVMQTLIAPFIPTDWEAECQIKTKVRNDNSGTILVYQLSMTSLIYFLAVVLISVIVWITVLCLASRRRGSNSTINSNSDFPGLLDKRSYAKIP